VFDFNEDEDIDLLNNNNNVRIITDDSDINMEVAKINLK
jgi:hypothetical protein